MLTTLSVSFAGSLALASALALTFGRFGTHALDLPGGIQKFHALPTPRIGGLAIFLALVAASPSISDPETARILANLLAAGAIAMTVGLVEDITGRAGVSLRLGATLASGFCACWLSGVSITSLDIPGTQSILAIAWIGIPFTAFAVAGMANAVNIIDGFNGLASGSVAISLAALAAISSAVGDASLTTTAVLLLAAVSGFWLVNFPWGRIFLGDGGAYFTGFALAWLGVLLPIRNPSVSPWASLLVCGYPIIEALYSIARRWCARVPASQPDRGHLHSLIAVNVVHPRLRHAPPALQNSAVSVVMWVCAAMPALLGVTLFAHTSWLVLGAACSLLLYHWLYRRVARA